jgi:cobalt-zinc-cadmium efflux system outer membrane protein
MMRKISQFTVLVLLLQGIPAPVLGQAAAGGTESKGTRLEDLIRLTLERNPELAAARRAIDVSRSKAAPAGALPDPELMFGQSNEGNIVPFTTLGDPESGFSEIYVGVTQEIPFPGKRGLRGGIAEAEVKVEESRYKLLQLQVASRVKQAFYELFAIRKSQAIVEKEKSLLDQLAKVASARYAVGKGIQQDVFEAQVEISKVEERLILLERRRTASEAQLNTLLFRPLDTPIDDLTDVTRTPLSYTLAELNALAAENHPQLELERRQVDREALALDLAKKGKYPDFGVTFVYHNRGSNPPYWTIGGTARIPLYFGRKQRSELEGAAAALLQSRHMYEAARTQAFYDVKNAYLMASTADRLLKLYDEGIIRQASFSLESAVENYQVGKIDFLTLVTSWSRVLGYELTYYEQLAAYQKALAELEPLVGVELAKP